MAYGRLDVFWPDGKFDTFILNEDSVSVGRSTGNTIALDTDTISRYHFNIVRDGDQVYLVDLGSANGTFVDGGRLNGNERFLLNGGEEIQIGDLRILYHALDENPTVPMTVPQEDTKRIERETRDFKIDLQVPYITVTPGSYASFELTIANTSSEPQAYIVEVKGLPENWVRINRPQLEIDSQDSETVVINVKPQRRSDSKPGDYLTKVIVRPVDKPDAALDADLKVMLQPFSGFGMALASKRLGKNEKFQLHLHNQGSAPLPLQIIGRDLGYGLEFAVNPHQVNIGPGQRVQVLVEAKTQKARLFGPTQELPFDLVVRALDLPKFTTAVRGYFIDQTPFSVLLASLMAMIALFGLALLIFGVVLLNRTPDAPTIQSFIVNNGVEAVATGGEVPLQWTVDRADTVTITANNQTVLTGINPNANRAQLPLDNFSGDVIVSLIAENRGGTTIVSRTVRVYQPVIIRSFTYSPQEVVRNVVQTITFRWDVPGASSVEISNVPGFQTVNRQNTSVQIAGLPQNDFIVTLSAADDFGNIQQQTVNVRLTPAECTTGQERVNLYSRPDTQAPLVNSIPGGSLMVVDARDQSGQWLRIPLPGGTLVWAQRTAFDCADNFNVEDLMTVVMQPDAATDTNPVPPLRTTTPVPTRTAPDATPTINSTGN